jgi:hypothetical protein
VLHKKFNKLQDEYFDGSKRMHEAKTVQEKMTLLSELQSGGIRLDPYPSTGIPPEVER